MRAMDDVSLPPNSQVQGIDEFNKSIIRNVIKELKKEQSHDNNNSNHWDIDAFSGQQSSWLGQMGPDDEGHSKNINFDRLQKLWERNL